MTTEAWIILCAWVLGAAFGWILSDDGLPADSVFVAILAWPLIGLIAIVAGLVAIPWQAFLLIRGKRL